MSTLPFFLKEFWRTWQNWTHIKWVGVKCYRCLKGCPGCLAIERTSLFGVVVQSKDWDQIAEIWLLDMLFTSCVTNYVTCQGLTITFICKMGIKMLPHMVAWRIKWINICIWLATVPRTKHNILFAVFIMKLMPNKLRL